MNLNRKGVVLGILVTGLVASYAVTRFTGLTKLPIFIDEAAFIEFATRVWHGDLFGVLSYGKLLHVWLIALVLPWTSDPLWSARAITVLGDGLALYASFQIGARLYNRRAGFLCAGLYVVCPFTLFHDRMALADGLLSTFAALTLLWSIAIVQQPKRLYTILLGVAMAGAILTKTPGVLTLLTPLVALALLARPPRMRLVRQLAVSYGVVVALAAFPLTRFWLTTEQGRFSVVGDDTRSLMAQVVTNLRTAYEWLWFYWTPPVFILAMVGLALAIATRKRQHLLLGVTTLITILAFVAASKIWFSRYLVPATVPALALVAGVVSGSNNFAPAKLLAGLGKFAAGLRASLAILFFAVVVLFAYKVDMLLLTNPALTPLPPIDRAIHIELWPSGYGVEEAASYLREAAAHAEDGIVVVHHEVGDTIDFGLKAYLLREKRIEFRLGKLRNASEIASLVASLSTKPTFVVLDRPPYNQVPQERPDVTELLKVANLVESYPKPGGQAAVDVYRLEKALSEDRSPNLLMNPSFTEARHDLPNHWQLSGTPVVDRSGREGVSGAVAVRCDRASDVLYQVVRIEEGKNYAFACQARGLQSGYTAKLQVNWLDAAGGILREDIKILDLSNEWSRYDVRVHAPERAVSATLYASPLDPSAVWFSDFAFAEVKYRRAP